MPGFPMDEALTQVVIDLSGRPYLVFQGKWSTPVLGGNFETELVEDFFQALAMSAAMNLHVRNLYGRNTHHIIEKACLRQRVVRCAKQLLSIRYPRA